MLCYQYCELFMSVAVEYPIVWVFHNLSIHFLGVSGLVLFGFRFTAERAAVNARVSVLVHKSLCFCCMYSNDWKHQDLGRHIFTFSRFVVVQSPSRVWLFETPNAAARQASLSLTVSRSLPKFMSIASVMPSSYLILWCPLLLLSSIFPASGTLSVSQLFASDNQNTGVSASASVLPTNIQGWLPLWLIGFDLLAVQGTLKSLL